MYKHASNVYGHYVRVKSSILNSIESKFSPISTAFRRLISLSVVNDINAAVFSVSAKRQHTATVVAAAAAACPAPLNKVSSSRQVNVLSPF